MGSAFIIISGQMLSMFSLIGMLIRARVCMYVCMYVITCVCTDVRIDIRVRSPNTGT